MARRKAARPGAKAILVIGHMDSVGYENAGADDNASGAAGVLEMAKILSGYKAGHDLNPCYHKACDKLEALAWDYASDIVRLNLAVIAGKTSLTPVKP